MAHQIDDRWLWLGVGVFAFLAVKGVQHALTDIVRLTEIDPYQYEPKRKKKDHPEDTLTVDDLRVLADSPHPNIANAAISLVLSRFARLPHATQTITKDLASDDSLIHQRAQTAVHFLRNRDNVPWDARGGLPLSPPGYATPTRWSEILSEGSEDGVGRRLSDGRDGEIDRGGVIVPSIEDPVAGWEDVPRERALSAIDGAGDDAEARRRRREAMVLHEGEGAVTGSDIIRPRTAGEDLAGI